MTLTKMTSKLQELDRVDYEELLHLLISFPGPGLCTLEPALNSTESIHNFCL